ncbi:MAG: response regulator transcription factor, partial [Pontiellaceae bacterium]|nr:response regulator transcription factor [Pontiellaceae bacterium]
VEAVMRRAHGRHEDRQAWPDTFTFGGARIDTRKYIIEFSGQSEPLSHRELELIRYFMDHPNEVLSRNQLLDKVWGVEYFGTSRTLDQHISKLRKKMESDPAEPQTIRTVHGVGYKYCP